MASSAVSFVVGKLGEAVVEEAALLYGVHDQVDWLRTELRWMESFLKDADAKRWRGDDRAKVWVSEVRDLAYRAEDIIDVFMLHVLSGRQPRKNHCLTGCVNMFGACSIISRHHVGVEIQGLRAKISQISASRERYGLVSLGGEASADPSSADQILQARRRLTPFLDDDTTLVVGFDTQKDVLLDRLLDASATRRCVVSIVGIGGLGKTTLATKVYNSSEIGALFDTRGWVSVSQDYKVNELLKSIIKQVMGITAREETEDDLKEMLYEFLKGRRYFLALDDIWVSDVWELVRKVLPDVGNGSRVLITTRSMEVARSADPSTPPYQLPFLNGQASWELFVRKAFPEATARRTSLELSCPEELKDVARQLTQKCGGLPLALLVLGGLMSRKPPTRHAWLQVAKSLDWSSTPDGDLCLKILALSYIDLPHHHLRSCFLYLGSFPEDLEMDTAQLVRLWVAEGFIPHSENHVMEDTARTYIEELVQRSMIQATEMNCDGAVLTCRIHDLFRDLCIREAREDRLLLNIDSTYNRGSSTDSSHHPRRLAIHDLSAYAVPGCTAPPTLRSLLLFDNLTASYNLFHGLKLLRVIDLEGVDSLETLPKEIGTMIHLRYLALGNCSELTSLPPSIGNLRNLQTLDARGTGCDMVPLPVTLNKIHTLRHLLVPGCTCPSLSNLSNLQTLSRISDSTSIEKLQNLRALGVSGISERSLSSLLRLKHLSSLELFSAAAIMIEHIIGLKDHNHLTEWMLQGPLLRMNTPKLTEFQKHESPQLPKPFEFPPNLTTLRLSRSLLDQDPMGTLGKLPNLTSLGLLDHAYGGKDIVCRSGGFPRLQRLVVSDLGELQNWTIEDTSMPHLSHLYIERCKSLTGVPIGLEHVTSLRELEVHRMSAGFSTRIRKYVAVSWCVFQQVRFIAVDNDVLYNSLIRRKLVHLPPPPILPPPTTLLRRWPRRAIIWFPMGMEIGNRAASLARVPDWYGSETLSEQDFP